MICVGLVSRIFLLFVVSFLRAFALGLFLGSIAPGSTLRATTGHLVGPHSLRPPPLFAGIGAVNISDPLGHRLTTLNTCGRLMAYCQNFSVGHRGTMTSAAVPTG
eukprot:1187301-Prorocentrum_minimum.AAC.2